jgi:hypothetical protein
MPIILDVVLALSESIPELDSPVTGTGYNLSVVRAETDRQNIGGVAHKSTRGRTRVEIPQTQRMVPGRGESKLAIG